MRHPTQSEAIALAFTLSLLRRNYSMVEALRARGVNPRLLDLERLFVSPLNVYRLKGATHYLWRSSSQSRRSSSRFTSTVKMRASKTMASGVAPAHLDFGVYSILGDWVEASPPHQVYSVKCKGRLGRGVPSTSPLPVAAPGHRHQRHARALLALQPTLGVCWLVGEVAQACAHPRYRHRRPYHTHSTQQETSFTTCPPGPSAGLPRSPRSPARERAP